MGRTIGPPLQYRRIAGSLAVAAVLIYLSACAAASEALVSNSFRLKPGQIARLTVRYTLFCAGRERLRVTLRFTDGGRNTLAKKETALACGDTAQLEFSGETAPNTSLTANLEFQPSNAQPPQAGVEVIMPDGPGRESSVVHWLRKQARSDVNSHETGMLRI